VGLPVVQPAAETELRSDAELLSEFQSSRSQESFSAIVARHGPTVYRTCFRIVGNVHDAEDAAQAVLIILARRPDAVTRTLTGWLHRIACRTAWRIVHGRVRRRENLRAVNPERPPDDEDLRQELDRALERLPENYREAVVLRYLEGRSEKEAARLAGCPQGTLGWRAMEGLNRLRLLLGRGGAPVGAGILMAFLAKEAAASAIPPCAAGALSAQVSALVEGGLKAMAVTKLKVAAMMVFAVAPALIGAGSLALQALQPAPKAVEMRDEDMPAPLAVEKFSTCFEAVKPYKDEWRWHDDIPWVGTIHEARARAAREDKPILAFQSADSPPLGAT
jgi:RNA polymerase sigma factor (sigma-70 family)